MMLSLNILLKSEHICNSVKDQSHQINFKKNTKHDNKLRKSRTVIDLSDQE